MLAASLIWCSLLIRLAVLQATRDIWLDIENNLILSRKSIILTIITQSSVTFLVHEVYLVFNVARQTQGKVGVDYMDILLKTLCKQTLA